MTDAATRAIRAVVVLALVLGVLAAPAPPAAAQEPGLELRVTELQGIVRPGGGVTLRGTVENPGTAPREDLRLVAIVQGRTSTREDYQQAVDQGSIERARVSRLIAEVPDVPPGGSVPVEFLATAFDLGFGAVPDRLAGVYPLRLELQEDREPVDVLTTSVVALPEGVGEPLRMGLLAPLDSAFSLPTNGNYRADPLAGGLAGDARLPRLAAQLAEVGDLPLTMATSGVVLDQAELAAGGYRALDAAGPVPVDAADPPARSAAALLRDVAQLLDRPDVEHIALPYASADLVALTRAGQGAAVGEAVSDGLRSAESATGDRPASSVLLPPDGLDQPTLDALSASTHAVVLDAANIAGGPGSPAETTPSPVRSLRTSDGQVMQALVADPWLSPLLNGTTPSFLDGGPVLAAQRLVNETAAAYFERPFAPEHRGLLLAPTRLWDPPDGLLPALAGAIRAAPWLRPVSVLELAADVPAPPEPATLFYADDVRARELPSAYLADVAVARASLGTLANLLTTAEEEPEEPASLDRQLQAITSVAFREQGLRAEGEAIAAAAAQAAEDVFGAVQVDPGPQIILSSRRGNVPVTVTNGSPVALSLRIAVSASRFRFAAAEQNVEVEPGQSLTVVFDTQALTPGTTAPVDVTVTDPRGRRPLAYGRVVVRSQASSVGAIVVTAGAGVFLALWWIREVRRGRRARKGAPAEGRESQEVVA